MVSNKGNAGECWKTTIDLISKTSNFARAAHFFCTFLCHCFAWLQRETSWKFLVARFMEEMSYVFSFLFFFHYGSFSPCLGGLPILPPPLQNFLVVLPTKKCLLCFLSLTLDLCHPFSRWASLTCCLLSPFRYLSPALYSKFVDMTINLS